MDLNRTQLVTNAFPCFSLVPEAAWRHPDITVERFSPQLTMQQGHLFAHAAFVLSGKVRIYIISESGREVTLYRVQRGGVCVLMMASILGETGYEASAQLEEETELLLLPVDVSVTSLVEDIAFKPINARIAELLLRRTTDSSNHLSITHEAIAIELGTAREVISRSLKEFEKAGWLQLGRGRIAAIHRDALQKKLFSW
ncbi:Crp/Fnr family transcriptional regulator [Brevibacillus porteri]|uniref:Crp/Fnr family transcriptional regulator n=1 Tax=Brevibacillus porteri TaxID=2126350 RepID=UPI00370A4D2A